MSSHLQDTPLSEEQRECVSIIQTAGESLLTIINDILDVSRIEAGRLTIEAIPFDVAAMVDEVVALVAEKAEEKGVELIVRYAPDPPSRVVGDSGRIRQALMNLVGNAIKFTHEGHILINVEQLAGDEASARLRLSVEDTGIGIPQDMLASVFEKFTQADGSITRRYGGTGLGLSISKQLVELMGGQISATSETGSGSTFSFTLTLPLDGAAPPPADGNFEDMRVLILHRHEKVRAVFAEQITGWRGHGYGVATGSDAVAVLRTSHDAGRPIHLAIIAHDIPDTTPEALVRAIKSDPVVGSTVVVLLATLRQLGDAEKWRAVGFDACLTRPARPSHLLSVLAATCDAKQAAPRS
jgi:CheY-like chemotaxis protein